MSELVAKGVVKTYGNKNVLQDVDLTLEAGKIYGLIGRNGAGKTTLLSILTSQNPASAGSVTFDGQPVWENPEVLRHLFFSRELNQMTGNNANAMKIKEYLRIAATFFPYWDSEMEKRLVREFDLDVKKKISKLSKGMLSMVTIIVAFCSKAEFTFLDEPVAGLDVVARERFYELLVEEYTETGRTFVVSTHIIEEAAEVLEEVIILDQGKILLKENTQDLLERSVHISGHEDDVNKATAGLHICREEHMGRSKGVAVLLEKGQQVPESADITIQRMTLQKIFVALCGEEHGHDR